MSTDTSETALRRKEVLKMSTRTVAYCALLAAIQVALARLVIPMPAADVRFSLEAIPVVLAGALFGPLPGALVGFTADLVGCLFSPFGYNPLFCLPPILYGLCGGFFRRYMGEKTSFWRILLAYMPAVVLGSWLVQSFVLAYVYNSSGAFMESLVLKLTARGIQFAISWPLEALITFLLFKSRMFERMKLWPPKPKKSKKKVQKES